VRTPVGYRCRECVRGQQQVFETAVWSDYVIAAVVVAPLALLTAFTGLRERRPRHVRLARWTLPLWLYVSVTGVLVYWMLYRLYPNG